MKGVKVATGVLQIPAQPYITVARSLHCRNVAEVEENGQTFVSVQGIRVESRLKQNNFPYTCPGPEKAPQNLADLYTAGIYIWDARAMSISK